MYSNEEAYDMLKVFFECLENPVIASREYAIRYPNRTHFSRKVFARLARCLRETGQVRRRGPNRRTRRTRNEENTINVLAYVEAEPHASTRTIARHLGVPKSSVHQILKEHRFHPYHLQVHQALTNEDHLNRLEYCNWLSNMIEQNDQFLFEVLWTDEAIFKNFGGANQHNEHYWSQNNPHWIQEIDAQHRWSVNVWCGIVDKQIIGPFIFENPLNGTNYLQFLAEDLPVLLENVSLQTRTNMWFQHDGCPAHYSQNIREFLNERFPNRWIGRGSRSPWPARSPDLSVLDFYMWGRIKNIVFSEPPSTRENMIGRIRRAINSISANEVEAAVTSINERVNHCIEQGGSHFEHLL